MLSIFIGPLPHSHPSVSRISGFRKWTKSCLSRCLHILSVCNQAPAAPPGRFTLLCEHPWPSDTVSVQYGTWCTSNEGVIHAYVYHHHQYIKFLLVCPSVRLSVTDVGMAITNLRVVCKIITCVPAVTEMIFLEIVKAAAGRDTQRCSMLQATRRMPLWTLAIVLAMGKNTDRIIWRAGPEQDTIFYLRVTACRE